MCPVVVRYATIQASLILQHLTVVSSSSSQVQIPYEIIELAEENHKTALLDRPQASNILKANHRTKRSNTDLFEEWSNNPNLERECVEERCSFEEANEFFENEKATQNYWDSKASKLECWAKTRVS